MTDIEPKCTQPLLPAARLLLLLWIASIPYRLQGVGHRRADECKYLLTCAKSLVDMELSPDAGLTVEGWTKLELRAGFGCADEAYQVLLKLANKEGSVSAILAAAAFHLTCSANERIVKRKDWIVLSLIFLSEERT